MPCASSSRDVPDHKARDESSATPPPDPGPLPVFDNNDEGLLREPRYRTFLLKDISNDNYDWGEFCWDKQAATLNELIKVGQDELYKLSEQFLGLLEGREQLAEWAKHNKRRQNDPCTYYDHIKTLYESSEGGIYGKRFNDQIVQLQSEFDNVKTEATMELVKRDHEGFTKDKDLFNQYLSDKYYDCVVNMIRSRNAMFTWAGPKVGYVHTAMNDLIAKNEDLEEEATRHGRT